MQANTYQPVTALQPLHLSWKLRGILNEVESCTQARDPLLQACRELFHRHAQTGSKHVTAGTVAV